MTSPASASATLPGASLSRLSLGAVTLTVSDLERSLAYYQDTIGLKVLQQSEGSAVLGTSAPLLELQEEAGATHSSPRHAGLYHFALLLPTRADLGRFVTHLIEGQRPVQGASDHLVSEAIYFQDPDGHGIEVYADRDAASWAWEAGQVRMGTVAADIQGIVEAAGSDRTWRGLPEGTVMGHVHLKVSDLERTRAFYAGLLGLDVVVDMAQQGALFVSQGGYHHHFGLNIWQSRGGAQAQDGEARLLRARVWLPEPDLKQVRARLEAGGAAPTDVAGGFEVKDPSGNVLLFGANG
ncbi:VOC family protein [Deinococcus ruber]|uniref:Glyoxalase/bleomycin resistance protein/dioxygenase n=1 Tax=Deinococcus ruber TaxID=1848197 RepID=A0A918BZ21_9DEIO|nr:VOC family protein [Deinococcus ruber]GGQ98839.1 glyoxalase/bleomycin resistance protein/dioxygenase [Deinococcus ruber]